MHEHHLYWQRRTIKRKLTAAIELFINAMLHSCLYAIFGCPGVNNTTWTASSLTDY